MMVEAVLALFVSFITGTVLSRGLWDGIIAPLTGYLNIYMIGFAAFFCLVALQRMRSTRREKIGFFIVLVAFGSIISMVAWRQAEVRRHVPLPQNANDGIIQSKEAATFFLHGQNPYTADFGPTSFGVYPAPNWGGAADLSRPRNPAFDHYVYLPVIFLIQVPLVLFARLTKLPVDYQTVSIFFFLACAALLFWISTDWRHRTITALIVLGTPFLWAYAMAGYSEFILLFFLTLSVVALDRNRSVLGSVAFGVALASKQTAWLLIPLWVYWIWKTHKQDVAMVRKSIGIALATAAVIVAPFLLWNPGAMYDDTIRYLSGTIFGTYRIGGVTLAQYLLQFGIIKNPWAPVSLWLFQLFFYLLTCWGAYIWVNKKITTSRVFMVAGIITLIATVTNRVGADNYFMAPLMLVIFAYTQQGRELDVAHQAIS